MDTQTMRQFIDTLRTEDDALDALNAIRARFDLAGTVFATADVTEAAHETLHEDHPELAEAFADDITRAVKRSYAWRKLGDIMADRGGETIADAVTEACARFFPDEGSCEYVPHLRTTHEGEVVTVIEGSPFDDPSKAYLWAKGHLGSHGLAVLDVRDDQCDPFVARPSLLRSPIEQVALAVTEEGQETALFTASSTEQGQ